MTERIGPRHLGILRNHLSERDLAIVRQVSDLRLMDARQIEAMFFGPEHHATRLTATRTCRRVLERLAETRLLLRLERRVGGIRAGSASFIYTLGPIGQRVLSLGGPRRRFREPTALFVDHTLAIGQLVVALTLAARQGLLDVLAVETEPRCWRTFTSIGGRQVLRPDLFVVLGVGEYERRWFVEIDRGRETLPVLVRKCRCYEAYYRSGSERAAHGVSPRTCWVVPDTARAERLDLAIANTGELTDRLFLVAPRDVAIGSLMGAPA
jgi:hypothetical protein